MASRPILAAVALVSSGAIVAATLQFGRKEKSETPAYTVAAVQRGEISQTVDTIGQLMPLQSVEVSTQISGLITEVAVDFNTRVKKGQLLARIDPSTYAEKLRQAQADFSAAQAVHALNAVNAKRLKGLLEADLVSSQDYDQAEALLRQSAANLVTHKAAVDNARVDLDRCAITAPIDGIVIFKQAEVGKTVAASFSAPTLFAIAHDLSRMQIIAAVNEVDIWSVKVGQEVSFSIDALPQRKFPGRVAQIRNAYTPSEKQQQSNADLQKKLVTFDCVIEVDNPDLVLRPNLTANVSILILRRQNALLIPNGALRLDLPGNVAQDNPPTVHSTQSDARTGTVYVLPNGDRTAAPRSVSVHLGISDGIATEILSGLRTDESVITGIASGWKQVL